MDEKTIDEPIQRKQAEDSIKQEFEQTLKGRTARYLQVKPHWVVPYTHFSGASAECSLLFRDGHFYGCIALTQAVAEAIVKYLCKKNSWEPAQSFRENVKNLHTRKFISNRLKTSLLKIWKNRNAYHHLNLEVETVRQKLEDLAREKTRLLAEVESEIFHFTVADGKMILKHPKYWNVRGDQAQVFLRLDP